MGLALTKVSKPPEYFEWHKDIVKRKRGARKTRLQAIEGNIEQRFKDYEAAVDNKTLSSFLEDSQFDPHKADLERCYTGKTFVRQSLMRTIDKSQLPSGRGRCPYCGLTIPRTYDHYLPKEKYPELSVNPLNLIPCCNGCNSEKGSRWISGSTRLFIHFYSDLLPEVQFLFVRLRYLNGAVGATFRLERPQGVNDDMWSLIENHFRELKLLKEYGTFASDEVSEAYNSC